MPIDSKDPSGEGSSRPHRSAPRHSRPVQTGQDANRNAAPRVSRRRQQYSEPVGRTGRPAHYENDRSQISQQDGGRDSHGQPYRRSVRPNGAHPQQYANAPRPENRSGARQARPQPVQSPSGYGNRPAGYSFDGYDAQRVGTYGRSHESVYRVRKKHRSHRRRNIIIGVACAVVVLVVAVGASGFALLQSARDVKSEASQVMGLAGSMMDKVEAGDMQGLSDDAASMASLASSMRSKTDSPLWAVASLVPVYGSDISAARTLVAAFDDVASDALVPLVGDIQGISLDTMMSDGRVNVEMFQALAEGLSSVSGVVQTSNDQVQAIGQTNISQVTELVSTAKSALGSLNGAVEAANQFAPLIPQMLGADGQTRNYMIVAMTSSEIRAAGGFPGAQGLLTVSDGNISLGDFRKVVWDRDQGGVPITDEEYALFQGPEFSTDAMRVTSGDALYNPDFPQSANRMTEFWTRMYGGAIDGVVAVDPVFLQYLLAVVGGVPSPDGTTIDGSNAVSYLMSDVYWLYEYDTDYQDAIFSSVAGAAFDKLVSSLGDVDPTALVSAVVRAADEGRLLVWMQNADEEQAAADLGVSGAVLTDPSTAQVGVYINDYSFTKSEYYLDFDTVVGDQTHNSDGSTTYRMVSTLTNTMTDDIEAQLPSYLRAGNPLALSDGDLMLRVYVYAPAGGSVTDVSVSGDADMSMRDGAYNGVAVSWGEVHLLPGQTVTISYAVTTSTQAGDVPLDVRTTPTVQDVRG